MITLSVISTCLEPQGRTLHRVEHTEGVTFAELAAPHFGGATWAPFLNGSLCRDLEASVADGDFVHLVGVPSGMSWLAVVWEITKIVVTIYLVQELIDDILQDFAQSNKDAEEYHGFRTNYRPEGDAIPVIYGTVRTAGLCINQSILGTLGALDTVSIAHNETLNSLLCVSHGPIAGFGTSKKEIENTADGGGADYFTGQTAGLQVNGIDAGMLQGSYEWRTGTGAQAPITGQQGQIGYMNPSVIYYLDNELVNGSANPDGSSIIPYSLTGKQVYANRIQTPDGIDYARQFLSTKADRCVVQFLFKQGLYEMGAQSGAVNSNERVVQIQYWQTDSSGSAIPSHVTILPPWTLRAASTSMISFDWPFELGSSSTVFGTGGLRGYAALNSYTGDRLMMNGTGTADADLDLLCAGVPSSVTLSDTSFNQASSDQSLKFSFAAWVKVPDWSAGYDYATPPVQWLWHWGREATIGAPWPMNSVPSSQNLWAPDEVNSVDSFGSACCLAVDPDDVAGNGGVDSDDPYVVLMVYCWSGAEGINQASEMGAANGYMTRWISRPLGRASRFGTDWMHIGLTWDQTTWRPKGASATDPSQTGGAATVKCYVNAHSVEINQDSHRGADLDGMPGDAGQSPGWLYGMVPESGDYEGMVHIPLRFFTDNKTTLRIGGWDNISTAGSQPFQRSEVSVAGYAFVEEILHQSWFSHLIHSYDTFGNSPIASVSSLMADSELIHHVKLASPMDDLDAVGSSSDHYKNYAYPTGTTQAEGCLQIEDAAASVKTTGGPTSYSQTAIAEGAYYIVEAFTSSPTEDGQGADGSGRLQNAITVDSITTFLTDQYSYPGIALMSASLVAVDQISNSQPTITTLVHGRKIRVWDGESLDSPTFRVEWSNNPAWIAMDLLTNRQYGMGGIFSPDGSMKNIHLPSFFGWAAYCDEGVPDAYGTLSFFAMQTKILSGTQGHGLVLYFGMVDSSGASVQSIPSSWGVGKHMTVTDIFAAEVGSEWITKNDVSGGLNDASNLMLVTDMQFETGGTIAGGYHGWGSYVKVTLQRNRDSWLSNIPPSESPYPAGVFADQFNLVNLGTASQYEYRHRYNGALHKKQADAWGEVQGVFANGRAAPMKVGTMIMPVWDSPREPVALVGQGNIKIGTFELSYTDPKAAINSIEMEILDEDRNYNGQTVLVDYSGTQGASQLQQVHKSQLSLPGCTSRSQALREGTYRLNKYALSSRVANFEVGPDCIHLLPGDRIQVSHDVPQYGQSGRLPVALEIFNTFPHAESMFSSWTQEGGSCVISDRALLDSLTNTDQPPPITGYSNGAVLAYGVPTSSTAADGQSLAGKGLDPGYERTPLWAAQYVCVGDGLYPTPDWDGLGPISPLDRIDSLAKKVNFSIYCRQPTSAESGGASTGLSLIIYRICNDSGYVKAAHGAHFKWNGSGVLEFDSYIGDNTGASSPYGITAWVLPSSSPALAYGWHRIAVTYQNNAATGAGSAGVGDYLQARILFNYNSADTFANQPSFFSVADGGRGNQFLRAGDPSNLNLSDYASNRYWTGAFCNASVPVPGHRIIHDTNQPPPFYPTDKTLGTGDAGDRGYVILFDQDASVTTTPFFMSQAVSVNFGGSSSPLCTTRANQVMCFTGYFKTYPTTAEQFSCIINIRTGLSQTAEAYTDDGGQVELKWTGSAYTLTNTTDTGGGATITLASQKNMVRLNDATVMTDWVRVDIQVTSNQDYDNIGFQIGSNSTGSGGKRFYGWGFRLHGRSEITGTDVVNPYPHRGTRLWGPYYEPAYVDAGSAGEPSTFSAGSQIQLDRDVTVTGGKPAEVYLRSSFETDESLNTDVTEVLTVAYSELPSVPGAVITKGARTWISVSTPEKMYPRTGDLYSFGESGESTEDFLVNSVTTEPDSMVRKVECVLYNEDIYNDVTLVDIVGGEDGGGPGGVGDWGGTGSDDLIWGGPGSGSIIFTGNASPYRSSDGTSVPSWILNWRGTSKNRKMPYKEVRIFSRRSPNGDFQYCATIPAGVQTYRYDDMQADGLADYEFCLQPVGFSGACQPILGCPRILLNANVHGPILPAPTVVTAINGFSQSYEVSTAAGARLSAIEARIGGWIISTPAWVVDPTVGRFASRALLPVPTDSFGFTQGILNVRSKTLGEQYGKLVTVTGTEEFVDVISSRQIVAENDYAASVDGSLDTNLEITSRWLHWKSSSSLLGPFYYKLSALDATTARRTIVNAVIQGYQIRHETLGDLKWALGSNTGSNWSLEGPMKDDGGNASVEIEWRWTSTGTISGVDWRRFEPGEVYARKVQFRLKWTRKNAGDDVRLERFTVRCSDVPATNSLIQSVDGGTF